MLRAPIWMTSATSRTGSRSRASMSSVTIGRPVCALASASRRSPSTPRPWKAYGLVRGLYAPPRSIVAPAARTTGAVGPGRGLVRPAAEHRRPGGGDDGGGRHELLARLARARAGDQGEVIAAD